MVETRDIELSETLRAVSKRDNNPELIVADQLAQRGFAVRISSSNSLPPDLYADIHFAPETRGTFDGILETAEIRALSLATDGVTRPEDLIDDHINSSRWNLQTKRQVRALYWQVQAENHRKEAARIDTHVSYRGYTRHEKDKEKEGFLKMAVEETNSAQRVLENSKPLTLADITSLISDVVEKELSSR